MGHCGLTPTQENSLAPLSHVFHFARLEPSRLPSSARWLERVVSLRDRRELIEDLPNLSRERAGRNWFLKKRNARLQHAVAHDAVVRVARHTQNLHLRSARQQSF